MKKAQSPRQGPLAKLNDDLRSRAAYERCYNRFGFFVLLMLLPLTVFAYLTYELTGRFPATAASVALAVYAVGVWLGELLIRRALKAALGLDGEAKPLSGKDPRI